MRKFNIIIEDYSNLHLHLLIYSNFGPRMKESNLFIFSPQIPLQS